MSVLKLLPNNFEPESNGEALQSPTEFTDVVSSGFKMTRDNYNSNSRSRLISDLQDERDSLYAEIEGKELTPQSYSKYNDIFSEMGGQTEGAYSPVFSSAALESSGSTLDVLPLENLQSFEQNLHKSGISIDLHIDELKQKDPNKYKALLTDAEIIQKARDKANMSTAEFENVAARADEDTAFWGGVVGSLGGAMTDPINIATLPLGASAAGGVMRAIAVEAGIQAGIETATQPSVMAWQQEIGQEYDLGDAAANVMGAAVLGGAFTGLVRGARPTAQATFALMQKSTTFNSVQKQAAGYMSRVAHFKEANPNPKVTNELHTDTMEVVGQALRKGETPSTTSLPMTNKQFNEIDTTATSGLNASQKNTLSQVEEFQGELPQDAVAIASTYTDKDQFIKESLDGNNSILSVPSKQQTALEGRKADVSRQIGEVDAKVAELSAKKQTPKVKAKIENLSKQRLSFNKDLSKINEEEATPFIGSKNKRQQLSDVFDNSNDLGLDKKVQADTDAVPSSILETPEPINNAEMEALLKRVESIDNQKAQNASFNQLVESDPNKVITLEDGTTKTVKQLQDEFADDETFLNEISTCAIG